MATLYVRSTDGSDADNGSTWALAKASITGAAAIDAAGDTIYVSNNHAESTASSLSFSFATDNAPVKIICADDAAEPPTASAITATVTSTGNSNISFGGSYYIYGLTIVCGSGGSGTQIFVANGNGQQKMEFSNCKLQIASTGNTAAFNFSPGNGSIRLTNTQFKFGHASQKISTGVGTIDWNGGGIESGSSAITNLIALSGSTPNVLRMSGLDLSAGASTMNIVTAGGSNRANQVVIRNCKLPASWSGSLLTGTIGRGERVEMYNCDSGDTNYRMQINDYSGSIVQETVIVRTGGASDGTTALSHKFVTTANAAFPHLPLIGPEIVVWNATTGSSKTVTVEIVTDNVTLTDAECWLEVQYLGTSGFPLGSFASDAKTDVLATAANQATSTETWTTTGLTTPVKQKLVVTFTPQEKGFVHAVVKLAKASTTVYVCPKLALA